MKTSQINKIFEEISQFGLTPNEYFSLAMILQDKPLQERMNKEVYKKYLLINGWIDLDDRATDKVRSSRVFDDFMDVDFSKNVETYRSMWPSITLPTGKSARSNIKDLESRFKWFFSNYDNYGWELIFKATEAYISYYRDRGYAFMRTSGYFIYKEDSTRVKTSTMAEWCDKINDGVVEESYQIDV